MATVTKKELIDRITADLNKSRPRAQVKGVHVKRVVQKFLDMIVQELSKGNRLEFRDFGVFESKLRAARIAQNPKTLERVRVPAKRSVKFKVGRMMKQKLVEASGNESEAAPRRLHTVPSGSHASSSRPLSGT